MKTFFISISLFALCVVSFGAGTSFVVGTYQVGSGVVIDTRTGEIVCEQREDGRWYSTKTKGDRVRVRYAFRADCED